MYTISSPELLLVILVLPLFPSLLVIVVVVVEGSEILIR